MTMRRFSLKLVLLITLCAPQTYAKMPEELYRGLLRFQIESERYLDALVLMDETATQSDPVAYAAALRGFNLREELAAVLEKLPRKPEDMTSYDWFSLGKVFYYSDQCIPALKAFKRLKNQLSLEEKQEWAFYRANCFIKLGSDMRAAQVLSDILSGIWIAHAYYNLAMSYASTNTNKTKALVALRVASSLNQGKTRPELELNDRIHFASGAILLNENEPAQAVESFKKVHLDSLAAPQALYLNGVAQLELNDFRSATQSWYAVKKHALIKSGVAEALLAIPYAYERGGYISQAIEAYVEASDYFEKELDTMDKIRDLLGKHGFRKVLIEEDGLEGLEWFLTKDVARNTVRAAYYGHMVADEEIYDSVALLQELDLLRASLEYWRNQLRVFEAALAKKQKDFSLSSRRFNRDSFAAKVAELQKEFRRLNPQVTAHRQTADALEWAAMEGSVSSLDKRLAATMQAIANGEQSLNDKQKQVARLQKQVAGKIKDLQVLDRDLDQHLNTLAKERLALLRRDMLGHFERSEQGLIHILQSIAESKQARKNRLDGRYQ